MQIRDLPYADPGVPDASSGGRFLWWLFRSQLGGQAKALGWGLFLQAGIAALPVGSGIAVQAVVDRSGSHLALAGALVALCAVTLAVGDTMLHRVSVTNWITAASRLQQILARKAVELGSALSHRVAAGEIVTVSTGDIEKIGWFVEALSRFLAAAFAVVAIAVGLLLYVPSLGMLVVIGVPVLALAVLPLLAPATRRVDVQREKAGLATELASDTVAGLRVLRGIGGEELFLRRYREVSQEVRRAAVRSARMWSLIAAVQVLLPGLMLISVVWYGARQALDGHITPGQLVTVYSAVTLLLVPLQRFEEIAVAYSVSRPSAKRAARVMALVRTDTGDIGVRSQRGTPPAGDLYDPVSALIAPAGLLTAVVCGDPDAAGRLAERLGGHGPGSAHDRADSRADREADGRADAPGTDEVSSVLLGGLALDDVPLATARARVLVQDKDPVLLSGTLAELLDVPSSGAVDPRRALAAAQCEDVLEALVRSAPPPQDPRSSQVPGPASGGDAAMGARITERGRSLSGGQRQRLALARSLVADPEVLVLDEPTSAVDSHTEARIADGVQRLRAGRTTVVFASSPLLLDRADRVVFVHEGKAVAEGTHRDLLRTDARYRAVVTREADAAPRPHPGTGPGRLPGAVSGRGPGSGLVTATDHAAADTPAARAGGDRPAPERAAAGAGHHHINESEEPA
ncbi:ABC transporter ATP-binding protein [Streptomyces sp. NBC_01497]|uniref:ABC transporter ATP-binding protein n=1 Tax=Streptomyces sp. NBC_01497 TaxID=2903885 RepID=UPI002E30CAF3|nr:ABC transporter ATP-binding protein [Streptomyces sp. NBC_01497]